MDEINSPPSLIDDDVRWLMVRTAASLARLWARLRRYSILPGRHPMHPLCARDIDATEPWLDQVPGNVALSGLIDAAMLAESLLIDEAVRRGPIDRRRVCLIVQHVACGASEWTAATRRMADKLDVKLAPTVREEMNGASLHREIGQLDGTYAESTRPRDAS